MYPYVEIKRHYYCLTQNPLNLAWLLFTKSRSLQLRSPLKPRRLVKTLRAFILTRLGFNKKSDIKEFPVHGNLIIEVHGGYRVFSFSQKIVTKVINANSNPSEIMREIRGVRLASQFDFAPKIFRWNIEQGWYEEELINGIVSYSLINSDSAALLNMFKQEIAPCLEKMILIPKLEKTTVRKILGQCSQTLDRKQISRIKLDEDKIDAIYQFIQLIISKLLESADQTVFRTITHGDFSLRNMLSSKKGLVVIDWEGIAYRSALFDLYNFFLTELYYDRVSTDLISETRQAIECLNGKLNPQFPEIAKHLIDFAEIYRLLYYVERICMLVERGLNKKILEVIIRSIRIFSEYEKAILR